MMANLELANRVRMIQNENHISNANLNKFIKNHYPDLYGELATRTSALDKFRSKIKCGKLLDISIFERLYCIEHGLVDRPKCKVCGKNYVMRFIKEKNEYSKWCCPSCQASDPECIAASKTTRKERYGNENFNNVQQAKKTRLEKNGGQYHSEDFGSKMKATKKKNHGDENFVNPEKAKATIAEKLEENPDFWKDREKKTKQTKIANGYDPNWNNREKFKSTISDFTDERKMEIVEKRRLHCLNEYGVDSIAKVPEIQNKITTTTMKNNGYTRPFANKEILDRATNQLKLEAWNNFHSANRPIEICCTIGEFLASRSPEATKIWEWRCKECNKHFFAPWANWRTRQCPYCHPRNMQTMEAEIYGYLVSLGLCKDFVRNNRSVLHSLELDVYSPSLKFAVEFNGIFWHSVDTKVFDDCRRIDRTYHLNKTKMCEQFGIQLVHIFEDEWKHNERLCKSKLKKILCPDRLMHIDASRCSIKTDVNEDLKRRFFEKYNINGDDNSSIRYSLVFNGHVVAMMSFKKCRNGSEYQWNISSYCEMNSIVVDGGFETLLKKFECEHKPKTICYYADYRWEKKVDCLHSLAFESFRAPQLWWTNGDTRAYESWLTPGNASRVLENYDKSLSFIENAIAHKVYRIYDCGKLVFAKHYS